MHQDFTALLLESNVINFTIAMGLIIFFVAKALPDSSKKRKAKLEAEIKAAKQAKAEAESKLMELNKEIDRAMAESERIVNDAKDTAEKLRYQVMEEAKHEIEKMNANAEKEIIMQRTQAIESLRKEIAKAALDETEKSLKAKRAELDDLIKAKLKSELSSIS